MTKSFKIARKPGQVSPGTVGLDQTTSPNSEHKQDDKEDIEPSKVPYTVRTRSTKNNPDAEVATTRKTIEIPTQYFYDVKMRAVQRHMLEKVLWAEIVAEYLERHPTM